MDYSDRLSAADSQDITCYEPVTCQMHHLTIGTSDSLKNFPNLRRLDDCGEFEETKTSCNKDTGEKK